MYTSNNALFVCVFLAVSLPLISARIGLIAPNLFESWQLTCPEYSIFPCPSPGVFTETKRFDHVNHRFYEGYIGCTDAKVTVTTSGLATTNAALTTQLLIDYYRDKADPVDFVLTYGIAGGMDDRLDVGDVVVASKWSLYNLWSWQRVQDGPHNELPLENIGDYTREYGYWSSTEYHNVWFQPQELYNETVESRIHTMYFHADRTAFSLMQDIATEIEAMLDDCSVDLETGVEYCLDTPPALVTELGGKEAIGLTGDIFVDNMAWRQTLFNQYGAQSLDMETAAVAMVAETNNVPFLAFRSLSDLAGADDQDAGRVINVFLDVAVKNSITVLTQWVQAAYCSTTTTKEPHHHHHAGWSRP